MTDITINIKTGLENNEPKITTTTDNAKTVVPKVESPKVESPKVETPKAETKEVTSSEKEIPKDETVKNDDSKEMDMTEEEHAKMISDKTKPSDEAAPK